MDIIKQSLIPGIERNDVLFSTIKEQPTFIEKGEEVILLPEFYYTYEMIRQIYIAKETQDELLESVEYEKDIKGIQANDLFLSSHQDRRSELTWPTEASSGNDSQERNLVPVAPTKLLLEMMQTFPKDYLYMSIRLTGREAGHSHEEIKVPTELSGYLKTLGLSYGENFSNDKVSASGYQKSGDFVKKYMNERLSVQFGSREASFIDNRTPFMDVDGITPYSVNHAIFTKTFADFDVAGPSKLLFLLGRDYFTHTARPNVASNLRSLLMTGKMNEMAFLQKAEDVEPNNIVKAQVMKRMDNESLNDIHHFLDNRTLFSTFSVLHQRNIDYLLHGARPWSGNSYLVGVDSDFWETYKVPVFSESQYVSHRNRQIEDLNAAGNRNMSLMADVLKDLFDSTLSVLGAKGGYREMTSSRPYGGTSKLITFEC